MINTTGGGNAHHFEEVGPPHGPADSWNHDLPGDRRTSVPGGGPLRPHVALVKNSGWHMARHSGEQIKGLVERGWRVTAIADYTLGSDDEVLALGADTRNVLFEGSGTRPGRNMTCVVQLAMILRELRPDLLHCLGVKPMIHGGVANTIAKVPAVVHTVSGQGILGAEGHSLLKAVLRPLCKLALSGHPPVIFQNRDDLADFVDRRLIEPKSAFYIPGCGVDVRAFEVPTRAEPMRFVMASRMLWSKGVDEFVQAARIVKASHPHAQFSLFGGCREDYGSSNPDFIAREWLENLNREGVVRWHGRVEPDIVEQAMQSADTAGAVLLSRYAEGVPRFLIEAAACGLPIITTNTPGCRDVVEHRVSGYALSHDALAEKASTAMLRLLRPHDAARIVMGERSRELAMRFDKERVIEDTVAVYAQVMARQPL